MNHQIVSREEWLKARVELLAREKAYTQLHDEMSAKRRALPWVKIDKNYVFIKHYMLGPGQTNPCVGCALEVDHIEGVLVHLQNHDVSYVAVARAPIEEVEALRKQMGWRFPFVSSYHSDFNYDFNVSYTPEQIAAGKAFYNFRVTDPGMEDLSGDSVFYKDDAGQIFHTYSTFGRGGEQFLGVYGYLDVMPKGRNENGPTHSLGDWVRPHNMYGQGGMVQSNGRYHAAACTCSVHKSAEPEGIQTES